MKEKIRAFIENGDLKRFVKFAVTGCLNTLVDYVVFTLLSVVLTVAVVPAQAAGYACGMLCSYTINRSWTFSSKSKFFSSTLLRFLIANGLVLLLSLGLIYLAHDVMGIHKLLAKLLVTGFTVVVNFILSRLWVFKK